MAHDDTAYLGHIVDTARRAVQRVHGLTRDDFDREDDLRIVLTHWIQIIGEAASRVSALPREMHPEIPWRRIVAMRHRIVHDYMNIDEDILWEVATRSLPELITLIAPLVPSEEP